MVGLVSRSPAFRPTNFVGARPSESVRTAIDAAPACVRYYGYGKAALRDGLALQGYPSGSAVVLPASVPDGLVEPIRELGLEPRFYPLASDLGPVVEDLEGRLTNSTVAVFAVDYFGFPQPRFDVLQELTVDRGIDLVEDNAHSPLSRADQQLLGTRGDLGFTSFRKLLPVPDGAALYLDRRVHEDQLSAFAGVGRYPSLRDCRSVAASLGQTVADGSPTTERLVAAIDRVPDPLRRPTPAGITAFGRGSNGSNGRDPRTIYRRSKVAMSPISWRALDRIDPRDVVGPRRRVFRAWIDALHTVDGISPVYEHLPDGVCPYACPVVVEDRRLIEALERAGVSGVHAWPPLPREVDGNDAFPTANHLSRYLVPLPSHHDLDPAAIRTAVGRLSEALESLSPSPGNPSDRNNTETDTYSTRDHSP